MQTGERYHMCPLSQVDPTKPPPVSSSVTDVHNIELNAEGNWDLSDILPSSDIDIFSSLLSDFTLPRDKRIAYLVDAPNTSADVLR